jgi:hypothetical protein
MNSFGSMQLLLCVSFLLITLLHSLELTLPKLKNIENIEVYHLRSFPILLIETMIGSFKTQVSGLALKSANSLIVLEYKPRNYSTCFLPHYIDEDKASLVWDKFAEIRSTDRVDTQFWQQSTFIARINGVVYKKFLIWLEEYHSKHALYIPQAICSNEFEYNCFSRATTWDTFVSDR